MSDGGVWPTSEAGPGGGRGGCCQPREGEATGASELTLTAQTSLAASLGGDKGARELKIRGQRRWCGGGDSCQTVRTT